MPNARGLMVGLGTVGGVLGGLVGFLMRPAAPLLGQLPFGMVVSRGATMQGLDQILIPLAQRSFNMMLMGLIVGAVLGVAAGYVVSLQRSASGNQSS